MPFIARGTSYPLPKEDGRTGPTGSEIDTIETHFGVDYYQLMSMLAPVEEGATPPPVRPGYTANRALFALAWLAMHRADPSLSIADVMDEYATDEFSIVDDDIPANKGKAAEVPTPAGDEETEPAATS